MKITVFTSNQPRHYSLIKDLAGIASELFVVQECLTLFPGKVADFYAKSEVMQTYFEKVIAAELEVFGPVGFAPPNARVMPLKSGDLNFLSLDMLKPALEADAVVVFGASFIKPPLVDVLIEKKAVNIHMGVSPYYRGAACNFWALYDGNADLVGATIHKLSRGLDSGDMLFHAFPEATATDPFLLGMKSVRAAHRGLVHALKTGTLFTMRGQPQDASQEIRYTRNREFTDDIASEYLARNLTAADVGKMFAKAPQRGLITPYYDAA